MSDPVVGILGLICIIAVVVTLFRSKTQPAIAFIVFPAILGLILVLGGRYSFDNIATMIKSGLGSTGPTAALFVFSVLYFGIMTDAGMFDVIIGKLMGLVGDNVIGVALVTAVIALALAHAALAGWQEKRRGAGLHGSLAQTEGAVEVEEQKAVEVNELARPKLFLFNILLTVAVIALPIAVAMVVCHNCATFISPMVPATLLGTGLAEVDIKDHIKASFGYVWVFSILCMLAAILFGVMPL